MDVAYYEGVAEVWKIELAILRAKRVGLRRHDLEDAMQELMMEVVRFCYDPAKARGMTEQQALCGLLDRRLIDILRARRRHFRTEDPVTPLEEHCDPHPKDLERVVDVRLALNRLGRLDRRICDLFCAGHGVIETAEALGVSSWQVRSRLDELRVLFRRLALDEYLPKEDAASGQMQELLRSGDDLRRRAAQPVDALDLRVQAKPRTAAENDVA